MIDSLEHTQDADVALKFRSAIESMNITDAQRRQVRKKIDLHLLP